MAAYDAEQTRIATQAEATQAATASAAAQAATRKAARAEDARTAAIAQAARDAAATVTMIDVVGTISGTGLQILDGPGSTFDANQTTGECRLLGADGDIAAGTSVTVYDSNSAIVGTGTLAAGKTSAIDPTADGYTGTCEFAFTVPVPDGTSFQVEVAHRGKVAVSRTDVGAVSLALG